jgi:hypothetical protein
MGKAIVVFNAGSTSLKFGTYAVDAAGSLPLLCRGRIDSTQGDPHFVANDASGKPLHTHEWAIARFCRRTLAVHAQNA